MTNAMTDNKQEENCESVQISAPHSPSNDISQGTIAHGNIDNQCWSVYIDLIWSDSAQYTG